MRELLKDIDLKKVSGGIDENKRYTFRRKQYFIWKDNFKETLTILDDYIDVPYDTPIAVTIVDLDYRNVTNDNIPAWYIGEYYRLVG